VDVVIDVGANSGLYTLLGASLSKEVISVEPSPSNLEVLFHNIVANRFAEAR